MNAAEIVAECEARGVVLTVGETSDSLAFDAPPGACTPELRRRVAAHKAEVIELLHEREERAALQDAPEWQDAGLWQSGTQHPGALALLDVFARRGVGLSFVSVTPARARRKRGCMSIELTATAELCGADAERRGAIRLRAPEKKGGDASRSPLRSAAPPRHTNILRRPLTSAGGREQRTGLRCRSTLTRGVPPFQGG